MDKNLYLIHNQSGRGVDFDVLDLIILDDRIFVVLAPASTDDTLVCSTMMEGMEEAFECILDAEDTKSDWYVCILEVKQEDGPRCSYERVAGNMLEEIYRLFRKRNAHRFRFQ